MSSIQNLNVFDPFGEEEAGQPQGFVDYFVLDPRLCTNLFFSADIRIQQRNGRKTLTTVQGLPSDYDQKKLLKAFKKEFACNGTLVQDEELGQVIQLQGDQRLKVQNFLSEEGIDKKIIKIHGF
ncbi:2054_t:CDS:2 [Acaulospora morrowiae]|uniref:2054_t:CDS:1 n=1 Tax=Acaulospora morrowiae TaxID=94023 RepID=A0A9N9CMF8_9GLOM|nr:2054_t:CDS:2 [Acaulospora morrowiae]